MLTFDTAELTPVQIQNYLQYAVAPRPICFASTTAAAPQARDGKLRVLAILSKKPSESLPEVPTITIPAASSGATTCRAHP